MHLKYTHYFGNESSEELLESYGVETKKNNKDKDALLRPIQCPNCSESNIPNAKFCAKCRMVLTYDTYYETIGKEKDEKVTTLEKKVDELQKVAMSPEILARVDEFTRELNKLKQMLVSI
jgi:integrase/recombinase XerD